ncbi:MAG TPA: hypothetical protein VM537_25330 [Anaerolineae bacterium]|nr:hypothetical protein [Anaerolineae bacterium]
MARPSHASRVWITLHDAGLTNYTIEEVKKVRSKDLFDLVLKHDEGVDVGDIVALEKVFKASAHIVARSEYNGCPCCDYDCSYESPFVAVELAGSTLAPWRETL